jgi:hypothetical protein
LRKKNKKSRETKNTSGANNVDIPGFHKNMNNYQAAYRSYFLGTNIGIILGALLCAGGFVLTILGLAGSVNWIIKFNGISSRLTNASPGVFFAILGMILVWRFKPKVTDEIKDGQNYYRKLKLEMRGTSEIPPSNISPDGIKQTSITELESSASEHPETEVK